MTEGAKLRRSHSRRKESSASGVGLGPGCLAKRLLPGQREVGKCLDEVLARLEAPCSEFTHVRLKEFCIMG